MDAYPDTFAFIQIHHGDAYATSWGNSRASFYGLAVYPSSWFDGVTQREGAKSYAVYEFDYNNRRAVSTDVTIDLTGQLFSGTTYEIVATVCIEPDGTGKTMRFQLVEVLDYWPEGDTHAPRNTFRQAATTQDITLAPGECQEVVKPFTFDATSWARQANIKIVAWAQEPHDVGPAEVHQAAISAYPFEPPPWPSYCPWNCQEFMDESVGVQDFLELLYQWGQTDTSCDFDGGGVGVTDFLALLAHWGPCSADCP